jgi:hypothetical protein
VMVGALFGPAQVASRLINMLFGSGLAPPVLATLSAVLIVGAVVVLQLSGTWFPGAVAFALMLGLGSGINSIAQGTLPLWLFGSEGYGALTGRIAAVRLIAGAAAPFTFSFLASGIGMGGTLAINAGLGTLGILAFLAIVVASMPAASRRG